MERHGAAWSGTERRCGGVAPANNVQMQMLIVQMQMLIVQMQMLIVQMPGANAGANARKALRLRSQGLSPFRPRKVPRYPSVYHEQEDQDEGTEDHQEHQGDHHPRD